MSLQIILIIMIFSGVTGGIINYILPANLNNITFERIQLLFYCILLGLGATILIPLFLELAQSKLLDNIRVSWQIDSPDNVQPLKSYLIFAAYCFLAATAGQRFINSLLGGIINEQQVTTLRNQNRAVNTELDKVVAEKDQMERVKTKLIANNRLAAKEEEENILRQTYVEISASGFAPSPTLLSQLEPITVPDDPQKGRFGGQAESNGRVFKARVIASDMPDYYKLNLWVESIEPANPLNSDVIFYLHDSLRPCVYKVTTEQMEVGKALVDNVITYGAFTAGAITDNGNTLLELDLALQENFPVIFRER